MALIDKLTAIADGFRTSNGTTAKLTLDEMAVLAAQGSGGLIEDIPNTPGQWACLARASQMRDIKYTPKADMYSATTDSWNYMKAGTEYTGIIYSSVRALDWFIGYGVSMYSYLTALNNPKSVIYAKKYTDYFSLTEEEDPTDRANAIVYNVYGTNCSSFVSYCLGLPYLGTTGTIPKRTDITRLCAGTEKMTDFDALRNELKLCDLAGGIQSHIEIVTGIRRDKNGVIQEVDLTDSWPPRIRKITYTWDAFVQHCAVDYDYPFLRYNDLETVPFPENLSGITYSDIVTNRGDKVCIRPDMDISLNVLNVGDYIGIALFKDGVQIGTHAITADAPDWELMTLETDKANRLATGKYTAILYKSGETITIDSANETNSTSFIICAVTVSRNGTTYTYGAEAVDGSLPTPMQVTLKDIYGFTIQAAYLDGNNFNGTGTVVITPAATPSIIHVPFKTEYGFIIAECKYETETADPTGENLVPSSVDASGAIYNGTGYKDGWRFKSSSGTEVEQSGSTMTGLIECQNGDIFKVSGVTWGTSADIGFYTAACLYTAEKDYYTGISGDAEGVVGFRRNTALETGDGYVFEIYDMEVAKYIRFSMAGNGANMVVRKLDSGVGDTSSDY